MFVHSCLYPSSVFVIIMIHRNLLADYECLFEKSLVSIGNGIQPRRWYFCVAPFFGQKLKCCEPFLLVVAFMKIKSASCRVFFGLHQQINPVYLIVIDLPKPDSDPRGPVDRLTCPSR